MVKKISLLESASLLEKLSFEIDNGGEINDAVIEQFKDLRDNLCSSVDRAILFRHAIKASIAQVKEIKDEWAAKQKSLERVEDSFNNYALACVRAVGFPLKGEQGAIASQKNPPATAYHVPLASRSYSNILAKDLEYNIPPEFLERVEFFRVNSEAVKEAFSRGEKLSFADQTQGERAVWKPTPKGVIK